MAETALDFVVEDGPELILLSALLKSWDYRYVQPARFTSLQFFKVDVIISGLEMNLRLRKVNQSSCLTHHFILGKKN